MADTISTMLAAQVFAVVGASRSPEKYGYLVYKSLKTAGKTVYAVNPSTEIVDGDPCYPSLFALPQTPEVAVIVVPPAVTEAAVKDCARLGIANIWMQPGAESDAAVADASAHGISVVAGGPCIMVGLLTHRTTHTLK